MLEGAAEMFRSQTALLTVFAYGNSKSGKNRKQIKYQIVK
jgi:hypothetical protein